MGKRSRKRQAKTFDSRLRAVVTIASATDPAIRPGSVIVPIQPAHLPELGEVGFRATWPSRLLADAGQQHLNRAIKLRSRLAAQAKTVVGGAKRLTPDRDVLDFFQGGMAGILLLHHALISFAIEALPADFSYTDGKLEANVEQLQNRGIELLLSRVLSSALQKPNPRTSNPELWNRVLKTKSLRDDIAHPKSSQLYSAESPGATVFARLLVEDLEELGSVFDEVLEHYGEKR